MAQSREDDGSGIDITQWVHPKELKASAVWRNQHGHDQHPIDRLHSLGLLSVHQMAAGCTLIRMRQAALLRLGTAMRGEILKDITATGLGGNDQPDEDYISILKKLRPWQSSLVERICWQTVRENDYGWIQQCQRSIRDSFEELARVLHNSFDRSPEEE